jgi:hypothetical protein
MGTTGTTLTYYHYNGGWFFKNGTTNILDNVWHQAGLSCHYHLTR